MRKFSNSLFAGAVLLGSALSAGALTSPMTADQTFTGEETVSGVKFTINKGVTLTVGDGVSASTLTIENSGLNSAGVLPRRASLLQTTARSSFPRVARSM